MLMEYHPTVLVSGKKNHPGDPIRPREKWAIPLINGSSLTPVTNHLRGLWDDPPE